MLSLGARKAKHRLASWAFIINVSFSVSEFISAELEEAAEFLVFSTSFFDISGEHSSEDSKDEGDGNENIREAVYGGVYPKREYGVQHSPADIHSQKHLIQGIRAVSPVHHSIKGIFKFSHSSSLFRTERLYGILL